MYAALDFLGIKHTETTICEADDLIAGYALSYGKQTEIIISSFDSDFFQLITDHVSVLRYRGKETMICTPEYIQEKFGITPAQYADFKSLTGANAENIKKPSIRDSIIRNTERLKMNYMIIKLGNKVPLPFPLHELVYAYSGITTNEVLRGIGLK